MTSLSTGMIKKQTIENMVRAYQDASSKIETAFELLDDANQLMESAFGEYAGFYLRDARNDEIQKQCKKNAWRSIVKQTGMLDVMTQKRKRAFEEQIERDTAPDITVDVVMSTLLGLRGNMDKILIEAVQEVYDWLRPHRAYNSYKTNSEFKVGKKVVMDYCIDHQQYGNSAYTSFNHHKEQNIRSLDNVFHLLDGNGIVEYPGDFLTAIKSTISHKEWSCETEYFRAKWFKKGTLHIEFRRTDLVNELNRVGGSGMLKAAR